MMTKKEAIAQFGSIANLAKALDISVQAVHKWGDYVPPLRVHHIRQVIGGGGQSCDGTPPASHPNA